MHTERVSLYPSLFVHWSAALKQSLLGTERCLRYERRLYDPPRVLRNETDLLVIPCHGTPRRGKRGTHS
jgi:hypothetical protein